MNLCLVRGRNVSRIQALREIVLKNTKDFRKLKIVSNHCRHLQLAGARY